MNGRRGVIAAMLSVPFLAAAISSHADSGDAGAVRGDWTGPWYLGMTSGIARLTVSGDSKLQGTLQMTNNERFGADAVAVEDVIFRDGQLSFRAIGADGKALVGQLPLSANGTVLKGFAKYGGYNIRFEFARPK